MAAEFPDRSQTNRDVNHTIGIVLKITDFVCPTTSPTLILAVNYQDITEHSALHHIGQHASTKSLIGKRNVWDYNDTVAAKRAVKRRKLNNERAFEVQIEQIEREAELQRRKWIKIRRNNRRNALNKKHYEFADENIQKDFIEILMAIQDSSLVRVFGSRSLLPVEPENLVLIAEMAVGTVLRCYECREEEIFKLHRINTTKRLKLGIPGDYRNIEKTSLVHDIYCNSCLQHSVQCERCSDPLFKKRMMSCIVCQAKIKVHRYCGGYTSCDCSGTSNHYWSDCVQTLPYFSDHRGRQCEYHRASVCCDGITGNRAGRLRIRRT